MFIIPSSNKMLEIQPPFSVGAKLCFKIQKYNVRSLKVKVQNSISMFKGSNVKAYDSCLALNAKA